MNVFYRVHWANCPEFSAANAYSTLWASERTGDGSQVVCTQCSGKGKVCEYDEDDCDVCDGEGVEDCLVGYSACSTPAELIAYFATRAVVADDDRVIVFDGNRVGTGFDGEDLVIPTRVIKAMTWAEFMEAHR